MSGYARMKSKTANTVAKMGIPPTNAKGNIPPIWVGGHQRVSRMRLRVSVDRITLVLGATIPQHLLMITKAEGL